MQSGYLRTDDAIKIRNISFIRAVAVTFEVSLCSYTPAYFIVLEEIHCYQNVDLFAGVSFLGRDQSRKEPHLANRGDGAR